MKPGAVPRLTGRSAWEVFGIVLVTGAVGAAALAGWLAPHDPIQQYRETLLIPPAWLPGGSSAFPLGTDAAGRDLLARILYGARVSVAASAAVVVLAMVVGVTCGFVAGLARGFAAGAIMRTADVVLSVPPVLLAMVVAITLSAGTAGAIVGVALVLVPGFVRTTKSGVQTEMAREHVLAARALGVSVWRLAARSILPGIAGLLVVRGTLAVSEAVLGFAALGFVGLGVAAPAPEWGTMVAEAQSHAMQGWWTVVFPGAAIVATVLGFNLLGDALRDRLDPRLR